MFVPVAGQFYSCCVQVFARARFLAARVGEPAVLLVAGRGLKAPVHAKSGGLDDRDADTPTCPRRFRLRYSRIQAVT